MPTPPASATARASAPPAAGVIGAFTTGWRKPRVVVRYVRSMPGTSASRGECRPSMQHARATGPRLADVILGIQWGDEGKGRVVDYYGDRYDVIARFGGGDNAGHTIVVGTQKIALRIVPSGVLQQHPLLFVGGGTVVSLAGLVAELDMLAGLGVDISRVKVSDRAHIVFPSHAARDRAAEAAPGKDAIGTT